MSGWTHLRCHHRDGQHWGISSLRMEIDWIRDYEDVEGVFRYLDGG